MLLNIWIWKQINIQWTITINYLRAKSRQTTHLNTYWIFTSVSDPDPDSGAVKNDYNDYDDYDYDDYDCDDYDYDYDNYDYDYDYDYDYG